MTKTNKILLFSQKSSISYSSKIIYLVINVYKIAFEVLFRLQCFQNFISFNLMCILTMFNAPWKLLKITVFAHNRIKHSIVKCHIGSLIFVVEKNRLQIWNQRKILLKMKWLPQKVFDMSPPYIGGSWWNLYPICVLVMASSSIKGEVIGQKVKGHGSILLWNSAKIAKNGIFRHLCQNRLIF